MIFDLEIPSSNVEVAFIPQGFAIPTGITPLYYLSLDHKYKLPSDFLTVEKQDLIQDYAALGFDEKDGPTFVPRGDRFKITNIAKYSTEANIKIPLFWKHVIYEKVSEDTIKVTDYLGSEIDKDLYLIEELPDRTNIFINKFNNKILFIDYVASNKSFKGLLNLEPVFTEVGWDDVVIFPDSIPQNKYMQMEQEIRTSYTGKLYIQYDHEINLLRMPIANVEDNWYISILNTTFTKVEEITNYEYEYSIPEYYTQNSTENSKYKKITNKKCRVLFDNYVQLPTSVDPDKAGQTDLFVYDFYTKELKYAISTNKRRKDEVCSLGVGVYYTIAEDFNKDGIVKLPITLSSNDVVYADFWIVEDYYELRFLNFNSDRIHQGAHYAIYLKPNLIETELGVYFARIGVIRPDSQENIPGIQDLAFEKFEDYQVFLDENKMHHIATITVSSRQELDIIKLTDVRKSGGYILDKKAACDSSADVLYKDLIDGNISIPTNDTVIAYITPDQLIRNGILNFNKITLEPDEKSKDYMDFMEKKIKENMNISTKVIIQFDSGLRFSEVINTVE